MGIDYAIDELYATGWAALDTTGCEYAAGGRAYPGLERVRREFHRGGCHLEIAELEDFGCHRAEWFEASGVKLGSVMSVSAQEAAVYALARFRRACQLAGA